MDAGHSIPKAMNPDEIRRSIVVANMTPGTKQEAIFIHFQQRKHGGGDVLSVRFTEDGDKAVITFEEAETVEGVLNKEHNIGGVLLKVDRCPEEQNADEVFSQVTAILHPFDFNIQLQEAEQILQKIKVEVGISFEYNDKCFVIHGTLSQINNCHGIVKKYLMKDESIVNELCKLSVEAKAQTSIEASEMERAAEASSAGETVILATPLDENPEGKVHETKGSIHPTVIGLQIFSMHPLAFRFMTQFYNEQVQQISSKFLVELATFNGDTPVTLKPKHGCDLTRYNEACREFCMLVETVSQGMVTKEMDLTRFDKGSVDALIQYVTNRYPVITNLTRENGPYIVFGDAASVQQVMLTVQGEMQEQPKHDTAMSPEGMGTMPAEAVSIETFSHQTEKGVTISLRYGDITGEVVDAIVNPANVFLSHAAGLAKSIVQKGGIEIQRESDKLIKERGFQMLHVGDAVYTTAGSLPCKFVIHAVGPEWNRQSDKNGMKLLQKACVESLKLASQLGLSSVAVPAVSSGIFRAPLDACAFAMLNAVDEYLAMPNVVKKEVVKKKGSKATGQNKVDGRTNGNKEEEKKKKEPTTKTSEGGKNPVMPGSLKEIRFVLIDADSMDVFEREFAKRFGSCDKNITDDDDDDEV